VAAALVPFSANAAEPAPKTDADTKPEVLAPVVVTAPAIIQGDELDAYAAPAAVVSRRQIEDLNAMDFGSTLRTVPGVTISRRNIAGSYGGSYGGAVFIRGMGLSRPGGELTTLYDGVPRYNAVFSHPLLDLLSVDAAHAMRIYKGPQPQVFGNAFAAIAIEPRRAPSSFALKPDNAAPGDGFGGEISAAYGTDDTVVQSANVSLRKGDTELSIGQSFRRSSGNRPNSGGELQDYNARVSQELGKNWTATLTFDHTDNYAEDPGARGAATHQGDYLTTDSIAVLTFANHFDNAEGFIKPYWHNGGAKWFDQNPAGSLTSTRDTLMDWDNYGVRIGEILHPSKGSELTAGFDYDAQSGKMRSTKNNGDWNAPFRRDEFQIYSPYAAISQVLGDRNGFYAQPSAGLRFYAHNFYSSETAPHAGLVLGYKDTTKLHFNASRGVHYPGLNVAVFSQAAIPSIVNNPSSAARNSWRNLKAETLEHYEIGLVQQLHPTLQASVTGFHDQGRHRYVMNVLTPPAPMPPNGYGPQSFTTIDGYKNYGVEASLSWTPFETLSFFAGATWLHSSVDGLPYSPEWSASTGLTWRFFKNFRFSADLVYMDKMASADGFGRTFSAESDSARNPLLPSVVLLNAKLAYTFELPSLKLRQGEIFIAGENLTDRRYYYQPGYVMPGIGGMIGVKVGF
jgi:iron complex outermembrane receptor protein